MPHKSRGILKNGPKTDNNHSSAESLLPPASNATVPPSTTSLTMPDPARKALLRDDDAFTNIPIDDESDSDPLHRHRLPQKVQFPDSYKDASCIHHDIDAMSSHSAGSSVYGGDDDDSDYDWSDEEDLVDEQAKFNKNISSAPKNRGWGPKRIISFLLSSLIGSSFLAAVLVTPAILVHFFWYKPHPTEHRKYVQDNVQAWLFWVASNLVVSWGLAMLIDLVPVLTRYFISAFWGHVSEAVKARLEIYDSMKNTIKPAFYAGAAYVSWTILFQGIFDLYNNVEPKQSRAPYTSRLSQAVEFFFFLILIWRIQALLSHFVAYSFHQVAYKERIAEVENSLVIIEKLRQYRPKARAPTQGQTPTKSGARTPIFGRMTPFSSTQHFNLVNNALQKTQRADGTIPRRMHERNASLDPKALNRLSWQTASGPTTPAHSRGPSTSNLHAVQTNTETVVAPALAADVSVELETLPEDPSVGQVFVPGQSAPGHLNGGKRNRPTSINLNDDAFPSARPSFEDGGASFGNSAVTTPGNVTSAATAAAEAVDATIRTTARALKTAVLHDARNIKGDTGESGGLAWNVHSSREAKRLARSLFNRFKDRTRSYLIPADFYPAFPDHAAAEAAFKVFDKDSNGDISRAEIKTALLRIYKERRFLSRSMRDVGEALRTLDRMLLLAAAIIVFFISLSVFNVQIGDSLSSIYTLGIAASFIFKSSASSAFDSVVFLFVTHPYDTGDRVLIKDQNLVVRKVGLFATEFVRSDGTETYYFNSQLSNVFILNMRRSGKTFENLTMQVAWTTPLTKLDALERSLNAWLSTEENRWYEPSTNIVLQNIAFQRYLEITIGIGHNGNWQDWGLHNARRTAFHAAVHYYCRELGIVGYEAPLPIVYADPATRTYTPPARGEDPRSPELMSDSSGTRREEEEAEKEAKQMKPMLGFLPPLGDRSSQLRARKSRNRKANFGNAMSGD